MDDRLIVTASPHIRDNATTRGLMGSVLIALVPSIVASGLIFGMRAILLTAVTTLACVVFEYLYCKLMHKPNPVGDLSACVTGVILALNMPVSMPLWIAIVGALVAIVIIKQLFGGLGCCQLSVAAGSQYGGVQAVRHSGQSRAFKCGVKWEIHKSHHAVVGFHHQRVHQACRCGSRTASDGIRQTAGSAHDGSTHILVQQKVDQNRRFFRVLAVAVDGKGQIYFRKSAVGLPAKGDLIPYQKAAGIF